MFRNKLNKRKYEGLAELPITEDIEIDLLKLFKDIVEDMGFESDISV